MTFWQKLLNLFRRKKKDDWVDTYNREVAKPKNPLPLDPDSGMT